MPHASCPAPRFQFIIYPVRDLTAMNARPGQKMDVVPTVSVRDGEVVVVRKGRYERLEDEDGRPLEPPFFLEQVFKQYKRALVVDINGIEDNRPQVELLTEMADVGEIWVDPGARYAEGIIDILVSGVSAVVMGTKTMAGVEQLTAAFEMSENIYLGIDWDGSVQSQSQDLKHMSPRSLADIAGNLGMKNIVFSDLSRTQDSGPRPLQQDLIRELARGPVPLFVGGGIVEKDIPELERLGAAGALLSVLAIVTEAV